MQCHWLHLLHLLQALCQAVQALQLPLTAHGIVQIHCPSNTEESGAKGYKYEFPATVTNGLLTGSHGEEGSAGSLRIEGAIQPDGEATIRARGRTGNPDYAVKRLSSGTAYSYTIKAHFEPGKGTGTRMESRVCNFTFNR